MTADDGMATAQYTVMIALSLVLFVLLANAIVAMYGRGVLRAALDEGVRAGSRAAAGAQACQARAEDALADLLGGRMGEAVTVTCADGVDLVTASGVAVFDAWLPGVPDFRVQAGATAVREREP